MGSSEAGTSSGSEYQVFLSFRGPDTRSGFTDFLYHSLIDVGICVFRDDEELRVGERIDGALQRAIDNSRIYIPIFSQTYASSQWCLRELTQIVVNTSKSNGNKEILPIFFDVEPDDVKLKTLLYHDAILNLEREKKLSTERVDSWREALMEIDAIKGWEVKKYKGQGELIKLVVEVVVDKLKIKQKFVTEHLIGIDDRVVAVSNLLDIDSGGVRLIQIHGMGGIGKTTLAKVVFNQLSTHFGKCCCFLENVREKSSKIDGLVELQKRLLFEIGNATGAGSINEIDYGMKRTEETFCNKRVFIVLDDVDKSEQVEKLVGKCALCSGSRVLITTRNKNVLRITAPNYKMLNYEMEVMSSDHALQLFSRYAFNKDSPSDNHYDISKKIVSTIGRLPLAVEVIGSLLYNKTQELWIETLNKLSKAPPEGVFEKLRVSYDALTSAQQQIFLDIACFFIGEEKTNAIYMWRDCELFPNSGIEVLSSMSLIKIVEDNKFWMHDQLRDLGREIVCQENPMNPEERSRLWIQKEVLNTIRTKKMKNNVQAMELDLRGSHANAPIRSEEIGKFENLRFLKLNGGTFVGNLMDCFPKLRWIRWTHPSQKYKPTNMRLNNAVVLEFYGIDFINDQTLWSLIKEARKLKVLSLDCCESIIRTRDFSGCSTLEKLTFRGCDNLRRIDRSIGKLKCLTDLEFRDCPRLEGLPEEIRDLPNLERFSLDRCSKVERLPDSIFKWKSLRELRLVEGPSKGQLPSEIGLLMQLKKLVLSRCYEIRELPTLPFSLTHLAVFSTSLQVVPDLSNLTNLVELDLSDGSKFGKEGIIYTGDLRWIGRLSKLERLSLCLLHVPAPIELATLLRLKRLNLSRLNLQTFTQFPSSLLELSLNNFDSIVLLSSNLKNLSDLELSGSRVQEIQLDGLQLPNLTAFSLYNSKPLKRFMLSSMRKLKEVSVDDCPKLEEIHITGVLESLEELTIGGCESFIRLVYVDIHWESSNESSLILASRVFNKLQRLKLSNCPKILEIQVVGLSESLEYFQLDRCAYLHSIGGLSNLKNLKTFRIIEGHELRIVEGLDELEFLNNLRLHGCGSLESWINVSTTQLPNDCKISIFHCGKLCGVWEGCFFGSVRSLKHYEEPEEPSSRGTCTCFRSLFSLGDH